MEKKEKIQRIRNLSEKELEVLELFCQPTSYKEISDRLFISEGTVRSHMRTIYIKLDLFGFQTSIRRFKVIKEFCHLLNDSDYLEQEIESKIDPGKSIIPIEPDEERDELIDEMVEEDGKLWLMDYQHEPIKIIPNNDQVEILEPSRRIHPFQIILAVLAFIGFIAIVITVYEWVRKDDLQSIPVAQELPEQELEVEPAEEDKEVVIIPTDTQKTPTEIPTPEPTIPTKPAVLFEDDFESGLSEVWEIVSGNPYIVNGTLVSDKDTWLVVGDPSWKNYSIEFDSYADTTSRIGFHGFNAIAVRVQNIENMYVGKWTNMESQWFIVENGNWIEFPSSKLSFKAAKAQSHRITVTNDIVTVYVGGEKHFSFVDSRFSQGRVALMVHDDTQIDNFKVKEILE